MHATFLDSFIHTLCQKAQNGKHPSHAAVGRRYAASICSHFDLQIPSANARLPRHMHIITDKTCTFYSHPGHPERPERISRTEEKLRSHKDLPLTWVEPMIAPDDALLRAHSAEHLQRLERAEDFDMDTPYYEGIARFARRSVGGALKALQLARLGKPAFSLMRPPGHHAMKAKAMGFCYLNNIAVAVLEARAAGCKKVAVFDFDVHHGNGTEAILLNQPGVSFFSIHQFPCYPGTGTRNVGNNCFNFPVPPQTVRTEYRAILRSALEHLAKGKPDLVAVSAGFDAYDHDPLAQGTLLAEDFHWLGTSLHALGTPVFSVLEGGYSPELPDLIIAYLKGVSGKA